MKRNRTSSIEVSVVDMDKALKVLFEDSKKAGKVPDGVVKFKSKASKWGFVETPKGIYLIDYEACGPGCQEDCLTDEGNTVDFPIYYTYEGDQVSVVPNAYVKMDADDVREFTVLFKENFGEFVRKFGDRLESNFHNWNNHFESEMKEMAS
jgi:hypothetical protein